MGRLGDGVEVMMHEANTLASRALVAACLCTLIASPLTGLAAVSPIVGQAGFNCSVADCGDRVSATSGAGGGFDNPFGSQTSTEYKPVVYGAEIPEVTGSMGDPLGATLFLYDIGIASSDAVGDHCRGSGGCNSITQVRIYPPRTAACSSPSDFAEFTVAPGYDCVALRTAGVIASGETCDDLDGRQIAIPLTPKIGPPGAQTPSTELQGLGLSNVDCITPGVWRIEIHTSESISDISAPTGPSAPPTFDHDDVDLYRVAVMQTPQGMPATCQDPGSPIRVFTNALNLARPNGIPDPGAIPPGSADIKTVAGAFFADVRGGWSALLDTSADGLNTSTEPLRAVLIPEEETSVAFNGTNFPSSAVEAPSTAVRRIRIPFCFLGANPNDCETFGSVGGYPTDVFEVDAEGQWAFLYSFEGFDGTEGPMTDPTFVHTITAPLLAADAQPSTSEYPSLTSTSFNTGNGTLDINRSAHPIYLPVNPGFDACDELPSGLDFTTPPPLPDPASTLTSGDREDFLEPRVFHRVRLLSQTADVRCYEQELRVLTPDGLPGNIRDLKLYATFPSDPRVKFLNVSACSAGITPNEASVTRPTSGSLPTQTELDCAVPNVDPTAGPGDPGALPFDGPDTGTPACPTSTTLFNGLPTYNTPLELEFQTGANEFGPQTAIFVRYRIAVQAAAGTNVFFTERDDASTNPDGEPRGNRASWTDDSVIAVPPPNPPIPSALTLQGLSYGSSDSSAGTSTSGDGTDDATQLATIESVRALEDEAGERVLELTTSNEILTGGFRVRVRAQHETDWRELETFLESPPERLAATYFLSLPDGLSDELEVELVELEVTGNERRHGPYRLIVERVASSPTSATAAGTSLDRIGMRQPLAPLALRRAPVTASRRARFIAPSSGAYRIRYSTLARALDASAPELAARAANGTLRVQRGERAVAYASDHEGIAFWSTGSAGAGDDDGAYVVALAPGRRASRRPPSTASLSPASLARGELVFEADRVAAPATNSLHGDDYMMWASLRAGAGEDAVFRHSFDAPEASGAGELTLAVRGGSQSMRFPDHGLQVLLNGQPLGSFTFFGFDDRRFTFSIPDGLLMSVGNELVVQSYLAPGLPFAVEWVDWYSVRYDRRTIADNDQLLVLSDGAGAIGVSGFSRSDVHAWQVQGGELSAVLDVAVSEAPSGFDAVITNGYRRGTKLFAFVPSSLPEIEQLQPLGGDSVTRFSAGADYVIVTHPAFRRGAEALARYRESQGLSVAVFGVDELYDTFTDGTPSAEALSRFVADAERRWMVQPRYLVLVGDGSFDLDDAMDQNDDLIAIPMRETRAGYFGSDTLLGELGGALGLELAVGRIPAHSNEEVERYLEKVRAFESQGDPAATESALLLADDSDEAGDFGESLRALDERLNADLIVNRLELTPDAVAETRDALLTALSQGTRYLHYIGHAGILGLAGEGLLTRDDVDTLGNATSPMVLLAATCLVGRFGVPGLRTFGEALLLDGSDGAAAIFASAGLETNQQATQLTAMLAEQIATEQHRRLGAALLDASQLALAGGVSRDALGLHTLLGDPALVLWPNAPDAPSRSRIVADAPNGAGPQPRPPRSEAAPKQSGADEGCAAALPWPFAALFMLGSNRRRRRNRGER